MQVSERSEPQAPRRYLVPVVDETLERSHLAAACQLAARDGGEIVALVVGLVPRSLPMGADVPERWQRLEYLAARARRFGREHGQHLETILALSDSAGEAVVRLVEEVGANRVCLGYEAGPWAALRRWRDPLWRTVLDRSPCPVVLERLAEAAEPARRPAPGRPVVADHGSLG